MNSDVSRGLRDGTRRAYSAAAENPGDEHPFPVGFGFAESLGYPTELLESLPPEASESFAGVSNVAVFAEIPAGSVLLDLGCGAGLDSLIAARRTGEQGQVIGLDFSKSMIAKARQAAIAAGASNVAFCEADCERLPLEDASIDVALVNGIFNLNPARETIFHELARVMREGGTVFAAELVLTAPLPDQVRDSQTNWFA